MKIVEASGDPLTIGRQTGEQLREEIREHLEFFCSIDQADWKRRLPVFLATLNRHLPDALEEMEGTAEGANVRLDDILRLNLPMYADDLSIRVACTNIVFADGPDGPIWGKNNDGLLEERSRPVCGRLVRPKEGIPLVTFTFCGMLATTDGMNAEGLAVGHSSVGSIFQQSDHHIPIRLWAYRGMMHSRNTADFVRHMASLPLRGKGYTILCVDRDSAVCSIEAPCPLIQVRRAEPGRRGMNCVNHYQLPMLADADRRDETGKRNSQARQEFLDQKLSEGTSFSIDEMKRLLRHHGDPGICQHGQSARLDTEYSMIGLPQKGEVLFLEGHPCEDEFFLISV